MTTRRQAQIGFDEEQIADPQLAGMLDDREGAKEEMQPYKEKYVALDKSCKGLIEQMELEPGTYRCGGFVVRIVDAEERHIELERNSNRRISIRPAKAD